MRISFDISSASPPPIEGLEGIFSSMTERRPAPEAAAPFTMSIEDEEEEEAAAELWTLSTAFDADEVEELVSDEADPWYSVPGDRRVSGWASMSAVESAAPLAVSARSSATPAALECELRGEGLALWYLVPVEALAGHTVSPVQTMGGRALVVVTAQSLQGQPQGTRRISLNELALAVRVTSEEGPRWETLHRLMDGQNVEASWLHRLPRELASVRLDLQDGGATVQGGGFQDTDQVRLEVEEGSLLQRLAMGAILEKLWSVKAMGWPVAGRTAQAKVGERGQFEFARLRSIQLPERLHQNLIDRSVLEHPLCVTIMRDLEVRVETN